MATTKAHLQQALVPQQMLATATMSRAVCSLAPQGPIQAGICELEIWSALVMTLPCLAPQQVLSHAYWRTAD